MRGIYIYIIRLHFFSFFPGVIGTTESQCLSTGCCWASSEEVNSVTIIEYSGVERCLVVGVSGSYATELSACTCVFISKSRNYSRANS